MRKRKKRKRILKFGNKLLAKPKTPISNQRGSTPPEHFQTKGEIKLRPFLFIKNCTSYVRFTNKKQKKN